MDHDLVAAAIIGDQAAFMDLVRPRSNRLFAIALQILRDVDRAEDALQDALVIAWRDLPGLRDPERIDAWLRRLLINVCIKAAARERRRARWRGLVRRDGGVRGGAGRARARANQRFSPPEHDVPFA